MEHLDNYNSEILSIASRYGVGYIPSKYYDNGLLNNDFFVSKMGPKYMMVKLKDITNVYRKIIERENEYIRIDDG